MAVTSKSTRCTSRSFVCEVKFWSVVLLFPLNCFSTCLQDGGKQKLEKAKITLNDCLACSGCITSAESVLVTQQSHQELLKVLHNNKVEVDGCVWMCLFSMSALLLLFLYHFESDIYDFVCLNSSSHNLDSFPVQWDRAEGGGGVGVAPVQSLTRSTLWHQQHWCRQEAHIFLQRPWWAEKKPSYFFSRIKLETKLGGLNAHLWRLSSLLQGFTMCLTRALVGPSACWRARESLWSVSRGRSRTAKLSPWWHQLVQVYRELPCICNAPALTSFSEVLNCLVSQQKYPIVQW